MTWDGQCPGSMVLDRMSLSIVVTGRPEGGGGGRTLQGGSSKTAIVLLEVYLYGNSLLHDTNGAVADTCEGMFELAKTNLCL